MIALALPPAHSERYFALRASTCPISLLAAVPTINARQFRGVPPGEVLLARADVRLLADGTWLLVLCVAIRKGGFHLHGIKFPCYARSDVLSTLVLEEIDLDTYRRLWRE